MSTVGYATLQIIPSMQGVEGSLTSLVAPGATAAGSRAGGVFTTAFGTALKIGAVAATAAAAVGVGLYSIGGVFDDVTDTIRTGTGAQGDALDALVESAKNVGTQVPAQFDKIGPTIADLNTRLGLSGTTLETVASQYLEAGRVLGEDVDINATSAAFSAFKITGDEVSGALDTLFQVAQATGVNINDLAGKVQTAAPAMQNLGFSFEETAALAGTLDKAGIDSGRTLASLSKGLVSLAKDGEEPTEAFRRVTGELQGFVAAGDTASALDLASQVFGTRGATQFVGAIQSGVLNLDNLVESAGLSGDSILQVGQDTADLAEQWQLFKNRALVQIEPIATRVFTALGEGMAWLNDNGVPALQALASAASDRLGPALQQAADWAQANLVPALQELGGFVTGTLVPALGAAGSAFGSFVGWIRENETTVRVLATVLGVVLAPIFLSLAAAAASSAAAQVAAWVTTKVQAVSSAASQVAAHYRVVGGWVLSSAAAVRSGAQTVAIWALYKAEAIKGAASTVAAHARMVGAWIASAATSAGSAIASGAAWVAASARTVGALALQGAAFVAQKAVLVAGAAATGIATAAQWALNAAMAANPITLIIIAIVALVAALVWFFTQTEVGQRIWQAVWGAIQGAAQAVADWFTGTLVPWLQGVWDNIVAGVTLLGDLIGAAWDWIVSTATNLWNGLLEFLRGIPQMIVSFFMNWTLIGLIASHWESIRSTAMNVWNALVAWVQGIPGRFVAGLQAIAGIAGNIAGWVGGIRDAAVGKFLELVDWVAGVPGRILSALGNVGSILYNAGSRIISGLWDGLKSSWESVKDWVGGLGDWIADHKGPKEYDLNLLVQNGGWIMTGLERGLEAGIPSLERSLSRVSGVVAAGITAAAKTPVAADMSLLIAQADSTFVPRPPDDDDPRGGGGAGDGGITINGNVGWSLDEVEEQREKRNRRRRQRAGL